MCIGRSELMCIDTCVHVVHCISEDLCNTWLWVVLCVSGCMTLVVINNCHCLCYLSSSLFSPPGERRFGSGKSISCKDESKPAHWVACVSCSGISYTLGSKCQCCYDCLWLSSWWACTISFNYECVYLHVQYVKVTYKKLISQCEYGWDSYSGTQTCGY